MVAASIADVDGLGILGGEQAYWNYHHKLAHNLMFGVITCILVVLLSRRRLLMAFLALGLFHLHLLMDYVGSGPSWPIYYFWPYSTKWAIDNTHISWEFYSWQNISIALLFLIWTIGIAYKKGRTPLEAIMPSLDRQLVDWLRRRLRPRIPPP
jgi:hypothetical protein